MLDIDIDIDSAVDALCILCNYAPEGVSCQKDYRTRNLLLNSEFRILLSTSIIEIFVPLSKCTKVHYKMICQGLILLFTLAISDSLAKLYP